MVVDESQWQEAVRALRRAIGESEADTLISRFLDEPVRRDNLRVSEERLAVRIDGVRNVLEERIDRRAAEITATVRGELNSQMRSLLFGFVGLQVTIGGFVIGLVRFGLSP